MTCPASVTYTGAAIEPCSVTVTGAGGLNNTPAPVYANNTNAGTATASYTYPGDANHVTSTDSKNFTIDQAASVTTVTFEAGPYPYRGSAFTATATVTGAGTLNSLVSVVYTGDCTNVTTTDGCTATATFPGDANHTASSDTKHITITKAASSTSLSSGTNPSVFGQSVTFSATVTAVAPGAGTRTGTVTFNDGTTVIGSGTLNGFGVATFTTSLLAVGSHSISAIYGADTNFTGSTSATVTQVVGQAASSTSLSSGTNPSVFGQSVTFSATVTAVAPGAGTRTGTVTFNDGTTVIGSGTLNGFGVATFTTSLLAVGSHSISAIYGADTNFTGSTSATVTQVVNKANTTTVVVSSANPASLGQSVTLTATVSAVAPGAGMRTGTVTFKDGTTVLGSGTLNASGVATYSTSGLAVGLHVISAVYSGDGNFNTSTGTLSGGQQVSYRFDGFLQPINDTAHQQVCGSVCPISIFKAGSTVPVKFDLKRADGTPVSATSLPVFVGPVQGGPTTAAIDEWVYTDPPTPGGTFSVSGGHYQYNWSTKGLQAGYYYRIGAKLDDGTIQYVYIGLR